MKSHFCGTNRQSAHFQPVSILKFSRTPHTKIVSMIRKYHNHKNSEYDQKIPQSQTADNPVTPRGSCSTITKTPGRQIKQSNQLPLFPIKMIVILEWTYSYVQQNIEQLQTLTMGVTINKKSTTTEPWP